MDLKPFENELNKDHLNEINQLETELNEIKSDLKDPSNFVYEECSELKRNIQLYTEETIAKIKEENNLDINIEENKLRKSVKCEINAIQTKSELIIQEVEKRQAETISSYNVNEAKKFIQNEIEPLRERIKELKNSSILESGSIYSYINDIQAELVSLRNKSKYFIFENNLMELKHKRNQLFKRTIPNELNGLREFTHYICCKQLLSLHSTTKFSLLELSKKSSYKLNTIHLSGIFPNGNYLIKCCKKMTSDQSVFIIFDPTENRIIIEKIFDNIEMYQTAINNKFIAITGKEFYYKGEKQLASKIITLILNHNLEITNKSDNFIIDCSNEKFLCKWSSNDFVYKRIKVYDWSFKKVNNITIYGIDYNRYLHKMEMDSSYFYVWINYHLHVLDFYGVLLMKFSVDYGKDVFKIDHLNHLIVSTDDYFQKLEYHNIHGDLVREIEIDYFNETETHPNIIIYENYRICLGFSNHILFLDNKSVFKDKRKVLNKHHLEKIDEIEVDFKILESDLNKPDGLIEKECAELKRNIILHTNNCITKIKSENNSEKNVDIQMKYIDEIYIYENEFNRSLKTQINEVKMKSESLIEEVDKYCKNSISSYDANEEKNFIETELESLKVQIKKAK